MFCILSILLLLQTVQSANVDVVRGNRSICFVDHVWNVEERKCTPCPKGYFGFGCETKCGFPYYGLKCALNCSCNVEHCDHIYGCNRRIIDTNIIDSPKTLTTLSHITIGNNKWKENYGHIINKDNSVNGQTLTTEKESKWMRPVIFGIFGVAGLLFFITLIYLFTHRQIQRPSVVGPT